MLIIAGILIVIIIAGYFAYQHFFGNKEDESKDKPKKKTKKPVEDE